MYYVSITKLICFGGKMPKNGVPESAPSVCQTFQGGKINKYRYIKYLFDVYFQQSTFEKLSIFISIITFHQCREIRLKAENLNYLKAQLDARPISMPK